MKKSKIIILVIVIIVLLTLSFLPLWSKPVVSGTVRVNTWTKIFLLSGFINID